MNFSEVKRDNLGTIDLDKIKIENFEYVKQSKYNNFSFEFNHVKYFYKRCSNINSIYNELLAEEIAKNFGISCASYDLASKIEIISSENINKSFQKIEEKIGVSINHHIKSKICDAFNVNYNLINDKLQQEKILIKKKS